MRSFLFVFYCLLIFSSCGSEEESILPTLGKLTESVYASVTVQPEDLYDVYAAVPGILDKVYVEEGDSVAIGQVIATITANSQELNLEKASLNAKLARENLLGKGSVLSSIEDEIQSTKTQLTIDSLNFARQKRLWEQSIGSQSDFENKKLKYELSQSSLNVLRNKLTQTRIELESNYKQSRTALKMAESNLGDYQIVSKINGIVYSLIKGEGEIIGQQQPLAKIGKAKDFLLELLIDEVDIARLKIGQQVLISLDAYKDKVYNAKVNKIYPLKDNKTQTFKVEATFKNPPSVLYPGLSGEANILISVREEVLSIPIDYLIENNKVKTIDGMVEVETGLKNISHVEVISGLDANTKIIKP